MYSNMLFRDLFSIKWPVGGYKKQKQNNTNYNTLHVRYFTHYHLTI